MKRTVFGVTIAVLVVGFLAAAWLFRERRAERLGFMASEQAETFVRPHSPTRGPEDARVWIVEFTDPACETCAAFSHIVEELMAANPDRIRLVVRYAPFHHGSGGVVRILEAARRQGKFWETLDLLYETQHVWTQHHQVMLDRIWPMLSRLDLDVQQVIDTVNDPEITAILEQDLADAAALGVNKTPGFFVNGRPLEPFGVEPFAALVASELQAQYPE